MAGAGRIGLGSLCYWADDSVNDWESGKLGLDDRYVAIATLEEQAALEAAVSGEDASNENPHKWARRLANSITSFFDDTEPVK